MSIEGMVDITPEALNEAHQADLAIQGDERVDFKHAWWIRRQVWRCACRTLPKR